MNFPLLHCVDEKYFLQEIELELKKKELELRLTEASLEQSQALLNERTELIKQESQVVRFISFEFLSTLFFQQRPKLNDWFSTKNVKN